MRRDPAVRTIAGMACFVCLVTVSAPTRAATPAPGARITLVRPTERWVVQRDADNRGRLTLAGTAPKQADCIEVRTTVAPTAYRGEAVDWTPVATGDAIRAGAFSGRVTLGAGGWYGLDVRARQGDTVLATAHVERVGVGDVFMTAGQSNSANFGQPRQKAEDDLVVYFDGRRFVPAKDPMPGAFGGGGTPWPILGDLLARSTRAPVCFRSATLTYTQVKNWMPGVTYRRFELYKTLVERARWYGPHGVRAVLWHQGESDSLARTSAKDYHDRLATVIRSMSKDLGYDVPWFVAGTAFHSGSRRPAELEVLAGQKMLWQKKVARRGPWTDDLLGPRYRHDTVHFGPLGLRIHAERWFAAVWPALGK